LACSILKSKAEKQPREPIYHGTLGIAYAGLGRKEDAIREGKWAIELDHETPNALGLNWDKNLACIYVMLGKYDKAFDKLDFLFEALPARISIPLLQVEPDWEPLKDHPRFEELVQKYSPKNN
jgi:serine/threonine-protein kinase